MTANAIIATTPAQMQAASGRTLQWVETKLASAVTELRNLTETHQALVKADMNAAAAARMMRVGRARVLFYEKIKAAIEAGYYIVPPFDVQVFAIRVPEHRKPNSDVGARAWAKEANATALPIGEGKYVDPSIPRAISHHDTVANKDGTKREVAMYHNLNYRGVDLPVLAHKPELIEATSDALALKIFDALGIAPAFRAPDPIIVGQITNWKKNANPVTFFVAWWLNERDL